MPDYILACMENELIYGELTDHYWSDGGGVYVPRKKNEVQAEPKVLTNTKVKRRERTKHKRNNERAQAQAEFGTGLKISTLWKYPANPSTVAIRTGFSAVHAQVTVPPRYLLFRS